MAQLKDLIVNGASRFIGEIFGTNATFSGNVMPETDDTQSLGDSTHRWKLYGIITGSLDKTFKVKLNNTQYTYDGSANVDLSTIYAPTTGGTANHFLVSAGATATPTWKATANGAMYATAANGAITFGTLPTAQGGTGNTSYTASRLIYSESATKLSSSGHYASSTKIAINSTSEPSYNLYVNGTSYVTNTIARHFSAANTNPVLRVSSNNQDAIVLLVGHATSDTTPSGNYYKLVYKGTGSAPNNYLQLYGKDNSTERLLYQVNEDGAHQFNIGTNDSASNKRFIINGNNRYLSISAAGLQAYTGATDTNTASLLYLQYNGGNTQFGQSSSVPSHMTIFGNISPGVTRTYTLGTSSLYWNGAYINGSGSIHWNNLTNPNINGTTPIVTSEGYRGMARIVGGRGDAYRPANAFFGVKKSSTVFEYTTDGGATWTPKDISVVNLFNEATTTATPGFNAAGTGFDQYDATSTSSTTGGGSGVTYAANYWTNKGIRITFDCWNEGRTGTIDFLLVRFGCAGSNNKAHYKIERQHYTDVQAHNSDPTNDTWTLIYESPSTAFGSNDYLAQIYPNPNFYLSGTSTSSKSSYPNYAQKIRITFIVDAWPTAYRYAPRLISIAGYGATGGLRTANAGTGSEFARAMVTWNHPYLIEDRNTGALGFDSDLLPRSRTTEGSAIVTTNVHNIGTSSRQWANVYATTLHGALDGNAATATTATTLQTARTIDGVSFNGSANITHYGTCSTAAGTAAKTVAITGFTLATGAIAYVKFSNTNTANTPTLNINSTGAKNIFDQHGVQLTTASNYGAYLIANKIYEFLYDGTNYIIINVPKTIELFEKRTTSTDLNKTAGYGGIGAMFHLVASSSTTTGKPSFDGNVLQMNWDNTGGYDSQLAISTSGSRMQFRSQASAGTAWQEVAHAAAATQVGSSSQPVYLSNTGVITPITGAIANNTTDNAATATGANITTTTNALAYYTNTTGTFGDSAITITKASKHIAGFINGGQKSGTTLGAGATAEGYETTASGDYAHAEGYQTTAGESCHAEGKNTRALYALSKYGAHAEGTNTFAQFGSHSEGTDTVANGIASHAEGKQTVVIGDYAHAEGYGEFDLQVLRLTGAANATTYTINSQYKMVYPLAGDNNNNSLYVKYGDKICRVTGAGSGSFTFNETLSSTTALSNTPVLILGSRADGNASHSEGYSTLAHGDYSHAEGSHTIAAGRSAHVFGEYNEYTPGFLAYDRKNDRCMYVEIVGNGTSETNRSNARTLDWDGNESLSGTLSAPTVETDDLEAEYAYASTLQADIAKPNVLRMHKTLTPVTSGRGDLGSGTSPRYLPYKWHASLGHDPADGEIIVIKTPSAGNAAGVWLSINGNTDAKYHPIAINGTSFMTTHYASGVILMLVYQSSMSATVYALAGADATASVTGIWRVINYYDSGNTNTLMRTYAGSSNIEVPVLGGSSSTTPTAPALTSSYKNLYGAIPNTVAKQPSINLSTGILTSKSGFKGNQIAYRATCSTAEATMAKVATVTSSAPFTLVDGAIVYVTFTYALKLNAANINNLTLNVNSTGAKSIDCAGKSIGSVYAWRSGDTVGFIYNGSAWQMIGFSSDAVWSVYADRGQAGKTHTPGAIFCASDESGTFGSADNFTYNSTSKIVNINNKITLNGTTGQITTNGQTLGGYQLGDIRFIVNENGVNHTMISDDTGTWLKCQDCVAQGDDVAPGAQDAYSPDCGIPYNSTDRTQFAGSKYFEMIDPNTNQPGIFRMTLLRCFTNAEPMALVLLKNKDQLNYAPYTAPEYIYLYNMATGQLASGILTEVMTNSSTGHYGVYYNNGTSNHESTYEDFFYNETLGQYMKATIERTVVSNEVVWKIRRYTTTNINASYVYWTLYDTKTVNSVSDAKTQTTSTIQSLAVTFYNANYCLIFAVFGSIHSVYIEKITNFHSSSAPTATSVSAQSIGSTYSVFGFGWIPHTSLCWVRPYSGANAFLINQYNTTIYTITQYGGGHYGLCIPVPGNTGYSILFTWFYSNADWDYYRTNIYLYQNSNGRILATLNAPNLQDYNGNSISGSNYGVQRVGIKDNNVYLFHVGTTTGLLGQADYRTRNKLTINPSASATADKLKIEFQSSAVGTSMDYWDCILPVQLQGASFITSNTLQAIQIPKPYISSLGEDVGAHYWKDGVQYPRRFRLKNVPNGLKVMIASSFSEQVILAGITDYSSSGQRDPYTFVKIK